MDLKNFDNVANLQLAHCVDLLTQKRGEYAPDYDVLQNFKDAAAMNGNSSAEALWGYVTKQLVSVKNMVHQDTTNFSMTHWDEKLTDIINYMVLLKAIVIENHWNEEASHQPVLVENKENIPA